VREIDESGQAETPVPPSVPVVLAGICAFLTLYTTQPILPLLQDVFHSTHVEVSFTITAATIGVAIAAPLVGRIADKAGRKRVIVWSAALLALTTLMAATAPSSGARNARCLRCDGRLCK
jgi:MFS transporter, YNFM family, putative membrane transport protein